MFCRFGSRLALQKSDFFMCDAGRFCKSVSLTVGRLFGACTRVPTSGKLLQACLLQWLRLVVVSGAVVGSTLAQADGTPWPMATYSYFADGQKLEAVLADFAGSFSLSLSLSPGVSGTVSGKFTTESPTEFIGKLAGVYGFVWYTHAGTLFISKVSDLTTQTIVPPIGSLTNLRQALTSLGVLESRFGWGELPGQGLVMVSGPASYVKLIDDMVKQLPAAGGATLEVMVFKLRNASADDRTVMYRDRELTIPGLATILRNLISGQGSGGFTINPTVAALAEPLRASSPLVDDLASGTNAGAAGPAGTSTVGRGGAGRAAGPGAASREREARASSETSFTNRLRAPTVQADPRLNALIIQDMPDRMLVYKRLIGELDVAAALIEIEAMIIDINSDRAQELGINWGGRAGGLAVGFGQLSAQPAAGTLSVVRAASDSAINPGSILADAGNYLVSQIRLLESKGEARIQSRPSVTTMDNVGALLDLSETFFIRTQGVQVASVTPVTAGTTLKVTPRSMSEGAVQMVQLTIDIEDGQIQDRLVDNLPTVLRSSVSTQAIVRSGDTLLIAGHTQDKNVSSFQKVPGLGDLPLFGVLFNSKGSTVQRRERLFMIKPRIISLPLQVLAETVVAPANTRSLAAGLATTLMPETTANTMPKATNGAVSTPAVASPLPAPAAVSSPASTTRYMLNLGRFDPETASRVKLRVERTLNLKLGAIRLETDASGVGLQVGPYDTKTEALAAEQVLQEVMNVKSEVTVAQEVRF